MHEFFSNLNGVGHAFAFLLILFHVYTLLLELLVVTFSESVAFFSSLLIKLADSDLSIFPTGLFLFRNFRALGCFQSEILYVPKLGVNWGRGSFN